MVTFAGTTLSDFVVPRREGAPKRPTTRRLRSLSALGKRTRVCSECGERKSLSPHFDLAPQRSPLTGARYSEWCADCRPDEDDPDYRPNSPFEVAKRQVETIFGIPATVWLNRREHPLHDLHYARMVGVHNLRAAPKDRIELNPRFTLTRLWARITDARLTARQRQPKGAMAA
jgi:hypothetical protein